MTTKNGKTGLLLMNTGSAAAPNAPETRRYLQQFLMDPRIIDIPTWKRWLIVNCFILPFRPKQTAKAYQAIWTDRGSPLIAFSQDFAIAIQEKLPEYAVELGMAYGKPSIQDGIQALMAQDVERIILAPMFPQYASATTGAVLQNAYKFCGEGWNVPSVEVLPPFYADAGFLEAWVELAQEHLAAFKPDHILLSFHGLPVRQIKKSDPGGKHCLCSETCCDVQVPENRYCYKRQCTETARALAEKLNLKDNEYSFTFQSRLGRDPWLEPATDKSIVELAKKGVKRLAILSPAFVADCLETLEELGMQGKEHFLEHGGEELLLVPSLNAHPKWVDAFVKIVEGL